MVSELHYTNTTMSKYSWVITKDNLAESPLESSVGTLGPHNCSEPAEHIKARGTKFRMKDDDGEIYYYGFIYGDYEGFEPLDDFGMPNAGCTSIEYKNKQGEWEAL